MRENNVTEKDEKKDEKIVIDKEITKSKIPSLLAAKMSIDKISEHFEVSTQVFLHFK
jgi:hypothetical protein